MAVWYGGGKARAPMLEADPRAKKEVWRRDLRQIKALGFNTVRCWIDWASGEPAPGEYRFDTLDVLLELAEEEGLKVVVQVYMDSAPEWVGRQYPDSLFVSSNGQAIRPESSPGYCLDHPGVRQADLAFYEAVARRAGASPAFLGFDLWSEPHVINWANPTYIPNPEFCFCRNTVARFREWLKKKYGTLDALNAAWYRRYASWDEVEPNRLSTILSYTDYIDWKRFIADKLGEDLRARYEAVKRGAPDRVATSHAAGVGLFSSPHYWEGQSDDWTMAAQVDYYGTSFYPKHSAFVDRDVEWRGALLDFARSFGFANGAARLLDRRAAGRLRHDRAQRQPHGDAGGPADLDLERARARGEGHLHLRVLPDEHRLRVGRLRSHPARRHAHRARAAWRAGSRALVERALGALPRRAAGAGAGRGRLQPARALRRRPAARDRLRRAAGRGGRHRARLAARRLPRALPDERAARLRARRPPEGGRARAPTSSSSCPTR